MYSLHATYIQESVRAGGVPQFLNVQRFVLATIRSPLWQAALASRAMITGEGDLEAAARQVLWGSKGRGWKWLETPEAAHYGRIAAGHAILAQGAPDLLTRANHEAAALLAIAQTPGIGLVKAGFVCQLAFGFAGCIDTHNLRMYGIEPAEVQLGGVKLDGKAARVKAFRYLGLCERLGGPEYLWNSWCREAAERQPARYSNADAVSFWHVAGLGLAG